jgi:hypothetical protein
MNGSDDSYEIPGELWREARDAEGALRKSLEQVSGGFLTVRHVPIARLRDGTELTAHSFQQFLEPLSRGTALDAERGPVVSRQSQARMVVGKLIIKFVIEFFELIRKWVCKDGKKTFPLSHKATFGITSIAHEMAQYFGVHAEVGKAMAASVMLLLAWAFKGAFCRVTADEAMKELWVLLGA